ncbi:MAG: glycerophosphodiester phosphodiesterase [Winogradskyella sp.]|nr:MAG: glycerophosphodiester phosphodiesterase [Winogradskyella sp.]
MGCEAKHKIDIQGHRGCRGLLPENSLPAFEKAIDLGVNTLELDIAISKYNKVVVTHEPYMNSEICLTPEGQSISESEAKNYNLYQMDYDQIKGFDCGTKYHPRFPKQEKIKVNKPLLSEVFGLVKRKRSDVKFNIEIKSEPSYYGVYTPHPEDYVRLVLEDIELSEFSSRVNLQSFDVNILEEIKRQSPNMEVALLVDENESIKDKLALVSFKPEIISPYYELLDKDTVNTLRNEDYKIVPWTLNSQEAMLQMIDYQVDGIITDFPDVLINLLSKN